MNQLTKGLGVIALLGVGAVATNAIVSFLSGEAAAATKAASFNSVNSEVQVHLRSLADGGCELSGNLKIENGTAVDRGNVEPFEARRAGTRNHCDAIFDLVARKALNRMAYAGVDAGE